MSQMRQMLSRTERGQGLVEYALILVLVSVVVIVALGLLGPQIGNLFCEVSGTLGDTPGVCQSGDEEDENVVVITSTEVVGVSWMFIQATYNGGADQDVILTVTSLPHNDRLHYYPNHYEAPIYVGLICPWTITVTASTGESDSRVVACPVY